MYYENRFESQLVRTGHNVNNAVVHVDFGLIKKTNYVILSYSRYS